MADAAKEESVIRERGERLRRVLAFALLLSIGWVLFDVLQPFLVAMTWSIVFVLSLWPLYDRLRLRLNDRRSTASLAMTIMMLLFFLIPAVALTSVVAAEMQQLGKWMEEVAHGERGLKLIESTRKMPMIGERAAHFLTDLRNDPTIAHAYIEQNRGQLVGYASKIIGGLTSFMFNLLIAVVAAYFLFRHGESLAQQLRRSVRKIGGERMVPLLQQIRETVKGVVYGSILTAVVQAILAALGFWALGVPYPWLLGLATLVLAFIPFGVPLVWLPAAIWLFTQGHYIKGSILLGWGAGVVSTMDNILRPIFIGKAAQIPILLVFFGVIGGLVAYGMLGLFVGPVVCAVALSLWREWLNEDRRAHTIEISTAEMEVAPATAESAPK